MDNLTPCTKWAEKVLARYPEQLSTFEQAELEQHLQTCSECADASANHAFAALCLHSLPPVKMSSPPTLQQLLRGKKTELDQEVEIAESKREYAKSGSVIVKNGNNGKKTNNAEAHKPSKPHESLSAHRSEVARLLDQIRQEYEEAMRGISALAQGTSGESFITTRMENIGKLQTQLDELIGDNAIALVVTCLEQCTDYSASTEQATGTHGISQGPTGQCDTTSQQ